MTKKQFVTDKDEIWEWDETPEVIAAIEKLHQTIAENKKTISVIITE